MKKFIKFAILLVALGLSTTSCENWLDVNTDPNNPTEVTPSLVLPVAQFYSAQIEQMDRRLNTLGNLFMVNWSQADGYSWYTDEFRYNVTSSFYQDIFNNTYGAAGKQYVILRNLGEGYEYYQAIGKIMLSYHFQLLVDCYGDVPYSEALGRSLQATPAYDDAQTIYEDLIVQLTDAIALIKGAGAQVTKPGEDDAMFRGDMDEWIRFANTLKLRILVRQSDMAGRDSYITTEIAAINTEGSGYITSDVGINPPYIARESGKQNIIWDAYGWDYTGTQTMSSKATCASSYIISYLEGNNDPRISKIYEEPADGHLGVPQGLLDYDTPVIDQYEPAKVSNIGPGILQTADQPAIMLSLAESFFNRAEARQKGLITTGPTAKELYQSGITASFEYLGLDAAAATTYYSQVLNNVNYDNSTNKQEAIITQKWIAVNGINAEQSWFDYSRTGYPSGIPIPLNYSGSADRPVRIFYPAGEYSSNGDNVPTQPNAFTAKIFWAN
jgi:hypothetical protein